MVHIGVLIMAKNETKRLHVTLESIKKFADSLIMYDTGSTDDTIEIAENFCKKNNIPFRLKQGNFVDFSTSRNVSIDFADTFEDIDYVLLMDVNDELQGAKELRTFAEKQYNTSKTCFLVCQQWKTGNITKYYNIRFLKTRSGWRYKGVVHEYINHPTKNIEESYERCPENVCLFQDRTCDDDKTKKRFSRDKEMLLGEHEKDPTEPRTVFYLAQTLACLEEKKEAFKYYKLRTTLEGFWEERYQANISCGEIAYTLEHPWEEVMGFFLKGFEIVPRVEPLIKIAEYYRQKKQWLLSYSFVSLACSLNWPFNCILFIDKDAYDYQRWHLLGIVAFYVNKFEEGKNACLKAIESKNQDLDKHNLNFYKEIESQQKLNLLKSRRDKKKQKNK
jgi:glycosyltransferase involved in cell wall biosynthesis